MDAASLCSDLVKIKSENPPGDTKECAEYIGSFLEGIGIPVEYTTGPQNETNVYSKNQSNELLLCGHIDVVPAIADGWEQQPFSGINDGTFVHGRGASDMKGGCAAVLAAVKQFADRKETPNVSIAFVCDEEGGGPNGIRRLIREKKIHPCDCLLAEPTPASAPCIGQKGLFRAKICFNGEPAHSSLYPLNGCSAVMQSAEFLLSLPSLYEKTWDVSSQMEEILAHSAEIIKSEYGADYSRIFRHISYNPGIIHGGERVNIVAQKCEIDLDMRIPWGVSVETVSAEIRGRLPKSAEMNVYASAEASMTSPDTKLVQETCDAVSRVYQIQCRPMVQWAASDARALRLSGFNAIEYGPGELATVHGINEKVSIAQLNAAAEIYETIIQRYQ
ncbi:MAG TPA: ArgE/DapE family deacylase [Methanocorpusculum sp.]|nr:ArgE/DapE family deacylase [Methanocorpusculum sp.]